MTRTIEVVVKLTVPDDEYRPPRMRSAGQSTIEITDTPDSVHSLVGIVLFSSAKRRGIGMDVSLAKAEGDRA